MQPTEKTGATLSICIPTFNRWKCLARLLDQLANEVKGLEDEVQVCISDNASTDDTQGVVTRKRSELTIVYSRNERNLGYDQNAIKVLELASGEYVWYLGDDDLLAEGSVRRIVADIKNKKSKDVGAIFINACSKGRSVAKFGFETYTTFEKNNGHLPGMHIGFAGCVCLNRKIVKGIIGNEIEIRDERVFKKNLKDAILDDFVHTYLFLECIAKSGGVGIEPKCGVRIIADGEKIEVAKKAYLDIIIRRYLLEIKWYYPWFKEEYSWVDNLKALASVGAIAAKQPEYEAEYEAVYAAELQLFKENKPLMWVVKCHDLLRKIPLGKKMVGTVYSHTRKANGTGLKEGDSSNERMRQKIEDNIARINRMEIRR